MARDRKKNKEKKRIDRIETNQRSIFGDRDLTPYNVGKKKADYKLIDERLVSLMIRLTVEREKRNWTRRELARQSNITPSDIGRMESGRIVPYKKWVNSLEEVFGIPGKELFQKVKEEED